MNEPEVIYDIVLDNYNLGIIISCSFGILFGLFFFFALAKYKVNTRYFESSEFWDDKLKDGFFRIIGLFISIMALFYLLSHIFEKKDMETNDNITEQKMKGVVHEVYNGSYMNNSKSLTFKINEQTFFINNRYDLEKDIQVGQELNVTFFYLLNFQANKNEKHISKIELLSKQE